MPEDNPQFCLLLSRQRSGTTMLRTVLDQHPQIAAYPEIFLASSFQSSWNFWNFLNSYCAQHEDFNLGSAEELLQLSAGYIKHLNQLGGGSSAVIADVKYDQARSLPWTIGAIHNLSRPSIFELCEMAGFRIIHLERSNSLQVFVSNMMAEANPASTYHDGVYEVESVTVDLRKMKHFLEWSDRQLDSFRGYIAGTGCAVVQCKYEELTHADMDRQCAAYNEIMDFIGVSRMKSYQPAITKMTRPLHESVANFSQVVDELENTPYEWMLEC